MQPKYIWGLVGLGVGAVAGFFASKAYFLKNSEDVIRESVEKGIEAYIMSQESQESEEDIPGIYRNYGSDITVEPIPEGIDYSSFYHKPSPKELMRLNAQAAAEEEHPEDSGEDIIGETQEERDERFDAELHGDKKLHSEPFEITEDDYAEDNHYDKETLYWYDNDDTLATEGDEVIENVLDTIGNLVDVFDDPNREFVAVRNAKFATDYMVIRLNEAYLDHIENGPNWGD